MLIVYGAIKLGGIETFFLRLAKLRAKNGLQTKFLIMQPAEKCNPEMLTEIAKCADLYFQEYVYYNIPLLKNKFFMAGPIKKKKAEDILQGIEHIHVANGIFGLAAYRLMLRAGRDIPISIGFYHSLEHFWKGLQIPYFKRVEYRFIFDFLPKKNLFCFSQGMVDFYKQFVGSKIDGARIFRLGVINETQPTELIYSTPKERKTPVVIGSVGRLVDFKTYNKHMISLLPHFRLQGIHLEYVIYGDGPESDRLKAYAKNLQIENLVHFCGAVDYQEFNHVVSEFDIFIGSGTAIIQAAALGVPSIVGIESTKEPLTYGFFSDVWMHEYNINNLPLEKVRLVEILTCYLNFTKDTCKELSLSHIEASKNFLMDTCLMEFNSVESTKNGIINFSFNTVLYDASRLLHAVLRRLMKNHPLKNQYDS